MKEKLLKTFQKHPLWKDVVGVSATIHGAGYKAWLAGGCVRDGIMSQKPADFDVATDALPEKVETLFPKTVAVGKSFGVIRVVTKKGDVEVTTFRKDGDYKDGRHPENVEFSEPIEDAKRRDFTMNALFFDMNEKRVHDFVGGVKDIKKKTIRTVGDPDQRFAEDKLRILRAVRFVSQLGFKIDDGTLRAIKRNVRDIHQVSGERIFAELNKLFSGKSFLSAMEVMESSGLMEEIFPGFQINKAVLKNTEKAKNKLLLRWLLVFEQIPNNQESGILWSRLKTSGDFQNQIEGALSILKDLKGFRKLNLAQKKRVASGEHIPLALEAAKVLKIKVDQKFISKNRKLPKALVDSQMLIKAGVAPGPRFGHILREGFDAQLSGVIKNKKQALVFIEKLKTR